MIEGLCGYLILPKWNVDWNMWPLKRGRLISGTFPLRDCICISGRQGSFWGATTWASHGNVWPHRNQSHRRGHNWYKGEAYCLLVESSIVPTSIIVCTCLVSKITYFFLRILPHTMSCYDCTKLIQIQTILWVASLRWTFGSANLA